MRCCIKHFLNLNFANLYTGFNQQSELDTLTATLKQLENQKGEAQKRLDDLKNQVSADLDYTVLLHTCLTTPHPEEGGPTLLSLS